MDNAVYTVLLCLYMADPATYVTSNSCFVTILWACLFTNWKKMYYNLINIVNIMSLFYIIIHITLFFFFFPFQKKIHSAPLITWSHFVLTMNNPVCIVYEWWFWQSVLTLFSVCVSRPPWLAQGCSSIWPWSSVPELPLQPPRQTHLILHPPDHSHLTLPEPAQCARVLGHHGNA